MSAAFCLKRTRAVYLDLHAAVARPSLSGLVVGDRLGLAHAGGFYLRRIDAAAREVLLHRVRTAQRQLLVRRVAADVVGVPGHPDRIELDAAQLRRELIELRLAVALEVRLAGVERRIGTQRDRLATH